MSDPRDLLPIGSRRSSSSSRRRQPRSRPACEPLEGRSLCSGLSSPHSPGAAIVLADRLPRYAHLIAGPRPTPRPSPRLGRPGTADGPVLRDLVYRTDGDRPERLDVYLPAGSPPAGGWPVVLAIHGGGWRRFSRERYGPKVEPLRAFGYAVVAPNYTLSAPGRPSWPENLDDVKEAVRWVRRNASQFGFDAGRIAAIGESAGGHLAALLGTSPDDPGPDGLSSRVDAVIDFFGPADLAALVSDSRGGPAAVQMLGGLPEAIPSRYEEASPVFLASADDAPTLIVHGSADPVVNPRQSQLLADALRREGVPTQLVILPRAGHGFGPFQPGTGISEQVLQFLATFL
ncbi:alpha/beta hydrolase [Tautonia sociabilis]|uniref:Alpha/beta hydrolase n=1 Tax=Tautonia sociabilis TaxID=2080755 RepID=A0A432MQK5_9BACT|nr:alpha/beta hydrolase [Tautonia sociabilis]RUL89771.1 alpha/beta hydrolase [Tautonia sociabilis]